MQEAAHYGPSTRVSPEKSHPTCSPFIPYEGSLISGAKFYANLVQSEATAVEHGQPAKPRDVIQPTQL